MKKSEETKQIIRYYESDIQRRIREVFYIANETRQDISLELIEDKQELENLVTWYNRHNICVVIVYKGKLEGDVFEDYNRLETYDIHKDNRFNDIFKIEV